MKKSCIVSLFVWVACMALYGRLAWTKTREPFPAAAIGFLGGTFAAMLVGSVAGLFTGGRDRAALTRARRHEPLEDGRLEAVSGPIHPLGPPLSAPFTGRPCVAYEYDVKRQAQGQSDFAGVGLTPCVVDSARGPVKLLGWALLDEFKAASSKSVDHRHGEAFLATATPEKLGLGQVLSVLSELTTDDDGSIRKDFQIGDAPPGLEGKLIEEKIVAPGQVVTLLGVYSQTKGGFTPGGGATLNRIYPVDLERARKQLGGASVRTFGIGLLFFLGLHAILVPMWFLAPKRDSQGRELPENPSVLDERDCDRTRELLAAGADPNERSSGQTPLTNAARYGLVPCVESLLKAGARVEDVDEQGNTALTQAVMAGRDDVVAVLKKANARDFRITADNGRPVASDSEPLVAVKDYLAALQAGNLDEMARISSLVTPSDAQNLELWQATRPANPVLHSGWMTEFEATLSVRDAASEAGQRAHYHLRKTPVGWRIVREWLP